MTVKLPHPFDLTPRVQCASLSSRSKEYACGLDDSSVVISSWLPRSVESETVLSLKGHHGPVHGLSYSPNGQYLLSSSEDTTGNGLLYIYSVYVRVTVTSIQSTINCIESLS